MDIFAWLQQGTNKIIHLNFCSDNTLKCGSLDAKKWIEEEKTLAQIIDGFELGFSQHRLGLMKADRSGHLVCKTIIRSKYEWYLHVRHS